MSIINSITTTEATELTGHHVKYVRRLVKEDKIAGAKRKRDWWVVKELHVSPKEP